MPKHGFVEPAGKDTECSGLWKHEFGIVNKTQVIIDIVVPEYLLNVQAA